MINCVEKRSYRSRGRGVNESNNMVRVVLDMPVNEWHQLKRDKEIIEEVKKVSPPSDIKIS